MSFAKTSSTTRATSSTSGPRAPCTPAPRSTSERAIPRTPASACARATGCGASGRRADRASFTIFLELGRILRIGAVAQADRRGRRFHVLLRLGLLLLHFDRGGRGHRRALRQTEEIGHAHHRILVLAAVLDRRQAIAPRAGDGGHLVHPAVALALVHVGEDEAELVRLGAGQLEAVFDPGRGGREPVGRQRLGLLLGGLLPLPRGG